jgi:hypothetical protein
MDSKHKISILDATAKDRQFVWLNPNTEEHSGDSQISVGIRGITIFLEKGSLLFSSWIITQNTGASRRNMKYMDKKVIQYHLVVELILLFLIPRIKIKVVFVILESLTNFPKDSLTAQKKRKSIWLDPTSSKP